MGEPNGADVRGIIGRIGEQQGDAGIICIIKGICGIGELHMGMSSLVGVLVEASQVEAPLGGPVFGLVLTSVPAESMRVNKGEDADMAVGKNPSAHWPFA
jgi:hypothetical protein